MSNFSGSEFSKALLAFDHVIQDQACPSGRLDWEQNKLIKLVRARDIPLWPFLFEFKFFVFQQEIKKKKES